MPTLTTLVSFNQTDGSGPSSSLIMDANGDLFGTTTAGGDAAAPVGTVFEITKTANDYASTPTTLVNFNAVNGWLPEDSLIMDANGDLFGTTYAPTYGTAFEIAKTANGYASTPTTLVIFNGTDGSSPSSSLIMDANGDLFGTTLTGNNYLNIGGTVFEIPLVNGSYASAATVLASFNGAGGLDSNASLIADTAGDLFGTTEIGGAYVWPGSAGLGTVFEIVKTAGGYASTPTTLVSFNGTNGDYPTGSLIMDANGDLFGTTGSGGDLALNSGYGAGTVFEITKTASGYASTPTTLVSFNGADGSSPFSSLIMDANGDLFGTTETGGANGDGTVFEIENTTHGYVGAPITLASFNGADGSESKSGLTVDASGDLFGTTLEGGANGDGTVFELTNTGYQVIATPLPTPPYAVSDFNGDGNSDILWQNASTGQVSIWEMNGATPTSQTIFATVSAGWSAIGTGDFNGDGYADILWDNSSTGQVAIWEMNGTTPVAQTVIGTVPLGWDVAGVGDFNGDGDSDILWRNDVTGQVGIWEMNGTTPVAQTVFATVSTSWYVAGVGDFNGDGDADILWQNSATNQVAIWEMNGTNPIDEAVIGTVSAGWQAVGVGDFNGDGDADILWDNRSTGQVAIWEMNGTTPIAQTVIGTIANNWKVAEVGDFNGNGDSDILWQNTSTGALQMWTMNGTTISSISSVATVSTSWQPGVSADGQTPQVAYDFYGAGTADILWQNASTSQYAIWQMNGTTPVAQTVFATVGAPWSITGVGDFYGNGDADLLWQNSSTGQVAIWQMDGITPVSKTTIGTVSSGWNVAGTGDFYGVGTSDILWQNASTGQVSIWEMNGSTPVAQNVFATVSSGWNVAGTGNFYGPGDDDILWQNSSTGQVAIWQMNGSTPVSENIIGTVSSGWNVAGTGDFYGNGDDDILWQNSSTNQVAIWEMNGSAPVAEDIIGTVGSGWSVAEVGHISGSSDADILWQNSSTGQVALWEMNGATPTSQTIFATVPTAWTTVASALAAGH